MDTKLPIAETFTSIHGEGFWAGTPMTFFRLAGCTVGKPYKAAPIKNMFPILPTGNQAWECTTFDGRKFPCDTDFNKSELLTIKELLERIEPGIRHVCITGGEPLMHHARLEPFLYQLMQCDITPHIETSGTICPPESIWHYDDVYICCSPKANYMMEFIWNYADEVRLMVDPQFSILEAQKIVQELNREQHLFLCPLSRPDDVTKIDEASMQKCLELIRVFPSARISIQMHKILNVR